MSVRTSKLKNFQGQEYIVKEDIIDVNTGGIKTELNSLNIKDSSNSVNASGVDFSSLKVIGDCKLIKGANGEITLRIGPAVNSSLFNGKDGISNATVTYDVIGEITATMATTYSDAHENTTTVVKASSGTDGYMIAKCGTNETTATAAGNAVHFDTNTAKFKVYIGTGKDAATETSYELGNVDASETLEAGGTNNNAIELAITNWKEEPKKDSGANGYCANINFTFYPSKLFTTSTDFKITKIELIENGSIVATWTNSAAVCFYYVAEATPTMPTTPATASYTLNTSEANTKTISGVTYITTATTVTPTATGMANIAYPGYVSNKATITATGGSWFTTYNHTSTSGWTTWTSTKDTTMSLTATTKTLNKGPYSNPQLTIQGVNINGTGTGLTTSKEGNVAIFVCDTNGYTESNNGTLTDASRLKSDFTSTFVSTNLSADGNTDLQTYNGWIQYPSTNYSVYNKMVTGVTNPDYSTCAGDRYAYFKFTKTGTIMSGSISFGTVEDPKTEMEDGNFVIELSNGNGNWMNLLDIATTFSYGTSNTIGFSIPQAVNYGSGSMNCRVMMKKGTTTKLKSISMA